MTLDRLMADEVFVVSPNGNRFGPVKASVQGNNVIFMGEKLDIEEGGRILRPLPNGKAESHTILQVDFHKGPRGRLSHFAVRTRKDASLVPIPSGNTINISHSQGIQIGDGNVQNILGSLQTLAQAIDASDAPPAQKADAKAQLRAFLAHPITAAVLGSAVGALLGML